MRLSQLLCMGLTLALLGFQIGCTSFKKVANEPLLKPMSGDRSPQFSGGKSSERKLCMETAKAVAEQGHAIEAIKLYERAEELGSARQRFDLELAPLYAQVNQLDQAIGRYQEVIQQGDATAEVYNNLTWTLIEAKRYGEAQSALDASLRQYPGDERLLGTQACLAYHRNDHEAAFQQFANLYGDTAAHHNLAVLEIENGKIDGGLAHLQIAATGPNASQNSVLLYETLQAEVAKAQGQSEIPALR